MREVIEIQLSAIPRETEVLRLLGFREGQTQIAPPMAKLIKSASATGFKLLNPRAAYCEVETPAEFGAGGVFQKAEKLMIGVITIGSALEDAVDQYINERDLSAAMVLDAYGSAAAEAGVVEVHNIICKNADAGGFVAGRRLSPGYPKWPIEQQKNLFEYLESKTAGIQLNEFFVMTPRKSISFGIPFGRSMAAEDPELGCRYCNMLHCEFRRHPAIADGGGADWES
ncbi:MAG: vitamin B12 dependent-methionine synthase activation domain-containing protein [Planctomycetota bacterium]